MSCAVFVIDDEPAIRRYLAAAPAVRPEVALLDWMMHSVVDAETVASLRAAGCARIVICSAHVVPSEVERIRASGADDFLPKPCTLEDLERGLRRWLA